jgi:RNA polymerase sigma-70 factor (ECF subfamily)
VAALQYLPPRQRAVLLLTQVLNWSAAETAESLDMSVAAVNSALQRARATLDARNPAVVPRALSDEQTRLVARYVEAFERYDVARSRGCCTTRPRSRCRPYDLWLQGRDAIARWLLSSGDRCRARGSCRWRRAAARRRSRSTATAAPSRGR